MTPEQPKPAAEPRACQAPNCDCPMMDTCAKGLPPPASQPAAPEPSERVLLRKFLEIAEEEWGHYPPNANGRIWIDEARAALSVHQVGAPEPAVALSDEQIDAISRKQWGGGASLIYAAYRQYARAVIAAHEAVSPTPDSGDLGGASVQVSDAANRASADARDAARYRYLRDVSTATWMSFQEQWRMPQGMCDAIVDRQMEKQVSESSGGLSADMPKRATE